MQFRLVYQGLLRSNGDARHKQEIRRALHPQLRELWTHTCRLRITASGSSFPAAENSLSIIHEVGDFRYAPLAATS